MNKELIFYLLCFFCCTALFGHEEHQNMEENKANQESVNLSSEPQSIVEHSGGRPQSWIQWVGGFHLIFLHFPIALIAMTGVSELLFIWRRRPIYDSASRFMIIAAAVLAIPTALLGLVYSYTATYSGLLADFIWWHMWLGISTGIFSIFVVFLRERKGIGKFYYVCLFLLFLLVNVTGYLGGGMTFGPYHMYPPS